MDYRPLDILACYGTSAADQIIRWGTWRLFAPRRLKLGPSHVAFIGDYRDQTVWVESTSKCRHACMIRTRRVSGVQVHLPHERVKDYEQQGGWVDVYRLSPMWSLSRNEVLMASKLVQHFLHEEIGYDLGGALLSGTRVYQLLSAFPGIDLDEIFCSQLVSAVLMRLGRMNVDNSRRYNPARLLRLLVKSGVYRFEQRATPEALPCVPRHILGPGGTRVRGRG